MTLRAKTYSTAAFGLALLVLSAGAGWAQQPSKINPDLLKRVQFQNLPTFTAVSTSIKADQQEAKDLDGRGPSPHETVHLGQMIQGMAPFDLEFRDLVRLSPELIPDANEASGIYYYRPSRFFLRWDDQDGYYLTIDYKFEADDGRNVLLDARLTPGPVRADREVLARLLDAYLQKHPKAHARDKVRLLPLPARYEARFDWNALGVPAAEVAVTGRDRDTGQLAITLATDVGTRQILIKKLGDVAGLPGEIVLTPTQVSDDVEALAPFSVTAELRLADTAAYGSARWQRFESTDHTEWTNFHPFPVKMRYLAYLYDDRGTIRMRGWDLRRVQVEPGATARLANKKISNQVDFPEVVGAWYVYTLVNDPDYRDAVVDALTGGIGDVPVRQFQIEVPGGAALFEQHGLYKVHVQVTSKLFDPEGKTEIVKPYELASGDDEVPLAPLYVPTDHTGPLYTYRVALITRSGSVIEDSKVRQAGTVIQNILIGSDLVEELLAQ